jgi:hypothetical protein
MRSLPALVILGALGALSSSYADEAGAREKVKEAFAAAGKEPQATYEAARQAVTDPSFGALETGTQHAALVLAYTAAYKAKDLIAPTNSLLGRRHCPNKTHMIGRIGCIAPRRRRTVGTRLSA